VGPVAVEVGLRVGIGGVIVGGFVRKELGWVWLEVGVRIGRCRRRITELLWVYVHIGIDWFFGEKFLVPGGVHFVNLTLTI
jgi:hypothetical protein